MLNKLIHLREKGKHLRGDKRALFMTKYRIAEDFILRATNATEEGYRVTHATRCRIEDLLSELEQLI